MIATILKTSNKNSLKTFSVLVFLLPVCSFLLPMVYNKRRMKAQESVALFQEKLYVHCLHIDETVFLVSWYEIHMNLHNSLAKAG
jgi:hypothetical protein